HNLAPRFGLAWRPFGAKRTVLRSGYGIFYTSMNLTQIRADLGAAFPFLTKQTFNGNANNVNQLTMNNPYPDNVKAATDVSNGFGFDLRPRAAYLQAWNFSIENEVSSNTILDVSYMGSKGTHLGRRYD